MQYDFLCQFILQSGRYIVCLNTQWQRIWRCIAMKLHCALKATIFERKQKLYPEYPGSCLLQPSSFRTVYISKQNSSRKYPKQGFRCDSSFEPHLIFLITWRSQLERGFMLNDIRFKCNPSKCYFKHNQLNSHRYHVLFVQKSNISSKYAVKSVHSML